MQIKTKDLIAFRTYSEKRKRNFIDRLRLPVQTSEEVVESDGTGGDYWIRCISAIMAACKENDLSHITEKIRDINHDRQSCTHQLTILKYDRNLRILHNFSNFNFRDLFPEGFTILRKTLKKGLIQIRGFDIKVKTHHLFTFEENDEVKLGAILFVAHKTPYSRSELGVFAELIYNFLLINYSEQYSISPSNIQVIDVYSTDSVHYLMIQEGQIPSQLDLTITEIQSLLQD